MADVGGFGWVAGVGVVVVEGLRAAGRLGAGRGAEGAGGFLGGAGFGAPEAAEMVGEGFAGGERKVRMERFGRRVEIGVRLRWREGSVGKAKGVEGEVGEVGIGAGCVWVGLG